MRAEKKKRAKKERKVWRELNGKQCKTKQRLLRPYKKSPDIGEIRCFEVATNIVTGTLDYWLWIMDQKLRATFIK